MRPGTAILMLWALWALSWIVAAFWSNRTEKHLAIRAQMPYRLLMVAGSVVLFIPARHYEGPWRLWRSSLLGAWLGFLVIALGLAFTWWARIYLGRLWSATVTKKADHHVVDTGPYGIVRHPIYTGILTGIIATAVVKGTLYGMLAALVVIVGTWMKARLEEQWLSSELEPGAYEAYRRRIPMLVPFGPTARN